MSHLRLYVFPISTRRSLLYCQKLKPSTVPSGSASAASRSSNPASAAAASTPTWLSNPSEKITHYLDLATAKTSSKWLSWETAGGGWQKWLTSTGNRLLQNLPYEEWGLKSVMAAKPPAIQARKPGEEDGKEGDGNREDVSRAVKDMETRRRRVRVEYPGSVWDQGKVMEAVRGYARDEKQAFHRRWMYWSFVGMPVTIPFGLIPVLPNIPFFWLAYRAWSHWRALSGSKHIRHLLDNNLLFPIRSTILDIIYKLDREQLAIQGLGEELKDIVQLKQGLKEAATSCKEGDEHILMTKSQGRMLATCLGMPELGAEVERAVVQVGTSIERDREGKTAEEKKDRS